jgi:hypothetical protein
MNPRPLLVLAAIAAATSPDMGKGALERFKGGVREGFARDPMGSVLATVLGGAWLFYKAERGHNPKVKSYYDALVYVSTNLSVGYSDIFARTARGKAIGSVLMTYGPAMATKIFDAPAAPGGAAVPAPAAGASATLGDSREVLERLDRILAVLEATRTPAAGAAGAETPMLRSTPPTAT